MSTNAALTTIAVLGGTGKLGSGLCLRWAKAGYRVCVGSRDAERAAAAAEDIRAQTGADAVSGHAYAEAAALSDIVALTVPFASQLDALAAAKPALDGKVLIDCTVPLRPPKVTRVQLPEEGAAGLRAQAFLGDEVKVVSAFQNVAAALLQDLEAPIDCDVLIAGDDADACESVAKLARAAGMRGLRAGPLANCVIAEALTSALIFMNKNYRAAHAGLRITGLEDGAIRDG